MPQLPGKQTKPDAHMPTVPLGLLLLLIVALAFFGLMTVIFPGIGFIGLAFLLAGVLFWIQYVVWGRWLHGVAVRMEEKKHSSNSNEREDPNTE